MKKIRSVLFLVIVFFTFQSCQTIKEGFTSQKKKSTDEFLVEKKSPLVMPPDFNELPLPKTSENIEKNGEYFGLKIQGDSMIGAGINDGDTVVIKKTDTADNGKIVVALIDDHEAMLKRIRRKGKTVALESANRNYETKIFGPDRVKVQGVLVSLYRSF